MQGLQLIQQHPTLQNALVANRWQQSFPDPVLHRARKYTAPGYIRSPEIYQLEVGKIMLEASVKGNYRSWYITEIEFVVGEHDVSFYASCTCPVGVQCKHCVAVLTLLSKELKHATLPSSGLTGGVDDWLNKLKTTQNEPPPEPKRAPDTRFLAYCLSLPESDGAHTSLSLHIGRTLKSGTFRIDTHSHANADPLSPPNYMEASDNLPALLFQQLTRSMRWAYDPPLEGTRGHALLTETLKTGRLYLLEADGDPIPVRAGSPIQASLAWQSLPNGATNPCLDLPQGAVLLPVSPLMALAQVPDDGEGGGERRALLHPVIAGELPEKLLRSWHAGPVIPPDQAVQLSQQLASLPSRLPAPVLVETKTLAKVRPSPRLTLHRKNPFSHAGLHLSGQPEPIVAQLEFLYHGHSAPPESTRQKKFTVSEDKTLLTIPRHQSGEAELIELLGQVCTLEAASRRDPVSPKFLNCFIPLTPPKEWDLSWAQIISRDLPILREQGWEIILDTSAKIEVHAIGSEALDTSLTELPEHGIDWFQFDASYLTPRGNKQSLLPLLSAYLKSIAPESLDEAILQALPDDETILRDPDTGAFVSINTKRLLTLVKSIHDLFGLSSPNEPLHRIQAADLANSLELDSSETLRALAELGSKLKSVDSLPKPKPPKAITATLRDYQLDGFHWLQFLARHSLHGILADDMGLGKTLQALTHIQAEVSGRRTHGLPTLVIAPTSVVGNWAAEAKKFAPKLKVLTLHGPERKAHFHRIPKQHLVLTSYALLTRDFIDLSAHHYHLLILDEAQYIKNPAAKMAQLACKLTAAHRISLSGTPIENHLGELWSQMRFLMPGLLGSSEQFRKSFRTPIERHGDAQAQLTLNRRVAPLLLRRTKGEVATELPPKTEILHTIALHKDQVDLYETVRAVMDERVREAIADKGLAKSHIIVLDALLKLRQICCHPQLLKLPAARNVRDSAKLDFLTTELLPTLLEEGRKILLFSSFTSMLALIEAHLIDRGIPFAKITGSTKDRQAQVERFQSGVLPVFLISLKAGGTGLNLTAADTVIHYDPWWNPAAENQATDRAHRIGQDKPVFVHKLICDGTIEQRIQELQSKKAALVEALLTADTTRLKMDQSTLTNLLAPLPTP